MVAISSQSVKRSWNTVSFASTLYLVPILELLLAEIPPQWRPEVKLGLQEALVNAAKHGNKLDPSKTILVRFSIITDQYWWIISDEGSGFRPPQFWEIGLDQSPACQERECGRGLYILHQVFDRVQWNRQGTELRLCKQVHNLSKLPMVP
ncbi:anti-sigma regulatory factor [Phormidium sp. CLA17]|uniref:ATP-binding protein n=1 Tax=Leptolyngbya sp. Cla-17 TaxID=2803751 RepID=UPI0014914848|nr:anti-sigma regulatory factor [Leptolyngbya sp. Cla-17]MBM0740128.1 anti-sigma regulatory factor [Leptolyngbya sp. Cla-17]